VLSGRVFVDPSLAMSGSITPEHKADPTHPDITPPKLDLADRLIKGVIEAEHEINGDHSCKETMRPEIAAAIEPQQQSNDTKRVDEINAALAKGKIGADGALGR
jgi:hypothetical protein